MAKPLKFCSSLLRVLALAEISPQSSARHSFKIIYIGLCMSQLAQIGAIALKFQPAMVQDTTKLIIWYAKYGRSIFFEVTLLKTLPSNPFNLLVISNPLASE
jgi:hypothetical protein